MLGSLGVYAMSPYIGTSDVKTSSQFISNQTVLTSLVTQNYAWIKYSLERLLPQMSLNNSNAELKSGQWDSDFSLSNKGLG